ncbi:unnamed protein product [Nesidiocoris tenuis]|uniref:Uncharacterized protein n=1 Tax=Nesidiocoris tenuis TaxID=355587 RepID=A0A6H5GP12_9HEMI|nr:unnamed protein product [Nesidiocoris tenuis]
MYFFHHAVRACFLNIQKGIQAYLRDISVGSTTNLANLKPSSDVAQRRMGAATPTRAKALRQLISANNHHNMILS